MVYFVNLNQYPNPPPVPIIAPSLAKSEPKISGGGYAEVKSLKALPLVPTPYSVSKEKLKKFANLKLN